MQYAPAFSSRNHLIQPAPHFVPMRTPPSWSLHAMAMARSSRTLIVSHQTHATPSPSCLGDMQSSTRRWYWNWNSPVRRLRSRVYHPQSPCLLLQGIPSNRVRWEMSHPCLVASMSAGSEREFSSTTTREVGEAMENEKEVGLAKEKGERDPNPDRPEKPEMCTADELHYVPLPGTAWRLALWRYLPAKDAPKRKHPVLMLCGIGSNAYCFDLGADVSLARYLAKEGFDTWILEVRGAGLSKREGEPTAVELGGPDGALTGQVQDSLVGATIKGATRATTHMEKHMEEKKVKKGDESDSTNDTKLPSSPFLESNIDPSTEQEEHKAIQAKENGPLEIANEIEKDKDKEKPSPSWLSNVMNRMTTRYKRLVHVNQTYLSQKYMKQVSSLMEHGFWSERIGQLQKSLRGLLDGQRTSTMLSLQLSNAAKNVMQLFEAGQRSVTPSVFNLQERLNSTVGNVSEIIELVSKYDWDFDNYLEEDVPAAMEYVKLHTNPTDGKVLSIGHSMGGIILYAMMATRAEQAGIKAAVTVASSLDYGMSDSTLKLLVPLASPAHLLNLPVIPLGVLMSAVQPLVTRPPYPLAWMGYHVSAQGMMNKELFEKLVLTGFCTIPMRLLYQLISAFQPGGLKSRDGSVKYKELLKECKVPIMAIAGDHDMICPPSAVADTIKVFPHEVTYKLYGGTDSRHYSHYDLLCGQTAKDEVYPEVLDFLVKCDN